MEFIKRWLTDTHFDFMRWRKLAFVGSLAAVLLSWLAFFAVQPNWGIDFTGGTEIHLRFDGDVEISDVRGALRELGVGDEAVQQVGGRGDHEFKIRVADPEFGAAELEAEVVGRLVEAYGEAWLDMDNTRFDPDVGSRMIVAYRGEEIPPQNIGRLFADTRGVTVQPGRDDNQVYIQFPGAARQIEGLLRDVMSEHSFEVMSIDAVGPRVGAELRRQGILAVAATLGLVLVYIAFRFDITYAPGAIAALFHDVSIVVGIFVLLGIEFNLPMIGALLTIVGYSLNDTIVIFDRIRENRDRYRRQDTVELINTSINETLVRTVATSGTTGMAMLAFLFIGGAVIQDFALAMLLGIIFGTYSTVFVASPIILVMEKVKPHLARLMASGDQDEPDEDEGEEPEPSGPLTESERRRRERAERERMGATSPTAR